ncbi:MAG TPA: cysteine desulfurase family protein [Aeromicrobium sp.]|nr:cysteine desulfurase family protein [Aeromicrobium sp.]
MIYLDEAATTPIKRDVLAAMGPYLGPEFGNPSSHHEPGFRAKEALDAARRSVAGVLGCRASEVTFTSGGTESDNLALKGIALGQPRGRHVVISAAEHPAVIESAAWLEKIGFEVTTLGVDHEGLVSVDELVAVLRDDTTLVSVQYANNEVGTIQPVAELAAAAAARGVPFHTDAVQAAGWLDLSVETLGVQAMSISGHKLGAPKGIGVLYANRWLTVEPLIHGGGQEDGRRSGTENVAHAVGMATALQLAAAEAGDPMATERRIDIRDTFIAEVEESGGQLTGHRTERLPGHASFVFPDPGHSRSGESILLDLERRGIVCSSGSACAAGSDEPSHVLTAMGYPGEVAQTAVRFTFGRDVTGAQLTEAANVLAMVMTASA